MDYILLSALAPLLVASVFISYDIACQFKLKFKERAAMLPSEIQLPPNVNCDWGIPKCHCPMHKVSCQAPHSLNFKTGVGRTDSEGIERSWAELNRVANSTKEMGPGSRHNTLDDHIGHHNFRKYVGLGESDDFFTCCSIEANLFSGRSLHSRLVLAMAEQKRQKKIFDDFTASLTPEVEKLWTTKILEWEKDPKKPNPYMAIVTRTCLSFLCAITSASFVILRRVSGRSEEAAPSRGSCRGESGNPSASCHRSHRVRFARVVGGRKSVSSI